MDRFAELTGRRYGLFEYHGAPDAERVIVLMGSGCEAAHETVDFLNAQDEKVGVLKVRLYRPFDAQALRRSVARERARASPCSIARKSRAAGGEPLYLDCVNALYEQGRSDVRVVGGRYGLSSKEFTPAMIKAVFENLAQAVAEESFHGRHRRRCLAHEPRHSIRISRSKRTMLCARSSSGSDRTARWARTRSRSKSSARTRSISRRAISFTTRRNPAR